MTWQEVIAGKKVVAVAWRDAHYNTEECEESEVTHRPWIYITVGTLIRSDSTGVTLSCDVGEDGKVRGRNFIPREMVEAEWTVGGLPPRRRRLPAPSAGAPTPSSTS